MLYRKIVSVCLCLLLCAAMLPLVFAAETTEAPAAEEPVSAAEAETTAAPAQPEKAEEAETPPAFAVNADGEIVLWQAGANEGLRILTPGRANETETAAAQLLVKYIAEITGFTPETGEAGTENYLSEYYADGNKGSFIVIRQTEADTPKGSFTVRAGADGNLYIEAADARGLMNGVYHYLREFCGVNVYSADVITIPEAAALTVPQDYQYDYTPVLEYADTDWLSPHDEAFAVANGLNGTYSPIGAVNGGSVKYITFCHSLTTSIVPQSELFESHPDYFSLQPDGKRTPDQLCLSNPNVVNRAIEDVLRLIDEGYDASAPLNIISVTQDDNQNYCTCENCAAIAERYGGQSGLMLWFVNQIAGAVAGSAHPDVLVDTFAYQYTRAAPQGIAPEKNVCVRLCSIECCFAHPLDDPACEENAVFMNDLRDWAQICNRLYIWDYTTNYSQTLGLFPDFGVLQENIRTFADNHVVGIYEEGAYYVGDCNTEFADLRAYLLARFLYDPYGADAAELRNGFLCAYYGEGGEEIGQFLDYITAHAGDEEGHLNIGSDMAETLHGVTKADVKTLDALWDTAYEKATAAGNEAAAARIDRSRTSWEYYKACNGFGEYRRGIFILRAIRANGALLEKLEQLGVTRYNESKSFSDIKPTSLLTPDQWDRGGAAGYVICLCMTLLMFLSALAAGLLGRRRSRALLILPVLAAAGIVLAVFSRQLFRAWENIPLYFLSMVLLCLLVGAFAPAASFARAGFGNQTLKQRLIAFGIGAGAAVAGYNIIVLIVNNLIFGGGQPGYAICFAFCWHCLLVIAANGYILFKLFSQRKNHVSAGRE